MRKEDVPDPPPELKLQVVDQRQWLNAWYRVLADAPVKNVGTMLALRADYKTGARSHPGVELLMAMTGIKSDTTVRGALRKIREMGFAWRYVEGSKAPFYIARNGERKRLADEYRLTWPDDVSAIPMLDPDDEMPA